jgi:hypothetical protein
MEFNGKLLAKSGKCFVKSELICIFVLHTDYIMKQLGILTASTVTAKTPSGVIGMPVTNEALYLYYGIQ